jgi:hypothetical protein
MEIGEFDKQILLPPAFFMSVIIFQFTSKIKEIFQQLENLKKKPDKNLGNFVIKTKVFIGLWKGLTRLGNNEISVKSILN